MTIPDGTHETQRDHSTVLELPVPNLPRRSVKGLDEHEGQVRLLPFSGSRVWHHGQRTCPERGSHANNDFPSSSVSLPPIAAVVLPATRPGTERRLTARAPGGLRSRCVTAAIGADGRRASIPGSC